MLFKSFILCTFFIQMVIRLSLISNVYCICGPQVFFQFLQLFWESAKLEYLLPLHLSLQDKNF